MTQIDSGNLSIILPNDSVWVNEFSFSPISDSKKFTNGGRMEVTEKRILKNRSIKIDCGNAVPGVPNQITRLKVEQLISLRNSGANCYLTIADGRSFKVKFDNENGHIEASPMIPYAVHHPNDLYHLVLNFYEI